MLQDADALADDCADPLRSRFVEGQASLTGTGFACDAFVCAEPDPETVTAKLR